MRKYLIPLYTLVLSLVASVASAVPVFTVTTTQALEDVTAAGVAILAVSALMYGFAKIRQMLKA